MSSTVTATSSAPAVAAVAPSSSAEVFDPSANLPFDISTLKSVIPAHCFVKNVWTGIYYLLRDFIFIALCYAAYPLVNQYGDPFGILKFAWWNVTGFFGWCLFVVGHDCGHRTFAESVMVNDIFGHIAHAPLCVPFHGWRVSHRDHHQNHNHVEHDHSWRPISKTTYLEFLAPGLYARISKIVRFSHALLLIYPIYLLLDSDLTSGNHFNPWGRLFDDSERVGSMCSTLSVVTWLATLFYIFPVGLLLDAYFMPYLFFVCWLDLVTYLQHTDSTLTYYRDEAWSYLKGAMSTMDRSYGKLIDHLHHDIGTHMVHHIFFTKIPHYHLCEATEAAKSLLGEHYKVDPTPIPIAFLKSVDRCHWVEDEGKVLKFHPESELKSE